MSLTHHYRIISGQQWMVAQVSNSSWTEGSSSISHENKRSFEDETGYNNNNTHTGCQNRSNHCKDADCFGKSGVVPGTRKSHQNEVRKASRKGQERGGGGQAERIRKGTRAGPDSRFVSICLHVENFVYLKPPPPHPFQERPISARPHSPCSSWCGGSIAMSWT